MLEPAPPRGGECSVLIAGDSYPCWCWPSRCRRRWPGPPWRRPARHRQPGRCRRRSTAATAGSSAPRSPTPTTCSATTSATTSRRCCSTRTGPARATRCSTPASCRTSRRRATCPASAATTSSCTPRSGSAWRCATPSPTRTRSSTCLPDSDSNITAPGSPYHPGTAFMELQFYPPGYVQQFDGFSCSGTQWCVAMNIDSLSQNPLTGQRSTTTCQSQVGLEYVNFAYLTKNGVPQGPPNPVNFDPVASGKPDPHKVAFLNPGDHYTVTMHDTAHGLQTVVAGHHHRRRRLDDGQRGQRLRPGQVRARPAPAAPTCPTTSTRSTRPRPPRPRCRGRRPPTTSRSTPRSATSTTAPRSTPATGTCTGTEGCRHRPGADRRRRQRAASRARPRRLIKIGGCLDYQPRL